MAKSVYYKFLEKTVPYLKDEIFENFMNGISFDVNQYAVTKDAVIRKIKKNRDALLENDNSLSSKDACAIVLESFVKLVINDKDQMDYVIVLFGIAEYFSVVDKDMKNAFFKIYADLDLETKFEISSNTNLEEEIAEYEKRIGFNDEDFVEKYVQVDELYKDELEIDDSFVEKIRSDVEKGYYN